MGPHRTLSLAAGSHSASSRVCHMASNASWFHPPHLGYSSFRSPCCGICGRFYSLTILYSSNHSITINPLAPHNRKSNSKAICKLKTENSQMIIKNNTAVDTLRLLYLHKSTSIEKLYNIWKRIKGMELISQQKKQDNIINFLSKSHRKLSQVNCDLDQCYPVTKVSLCSEINKQTSQPPPHKCKVDPYTGLHLNLQLSMFLPKRNTAGSMALSTNRLISFKCYCKFSCPLVVWGTCL